MIDVKEEGRLVKVYKTRRKVDLYLYVDFEEDLGRVPDELLERFGRPELRPFRSAPGQRPRCPLRPEGRRQRRDGGSTRSGDPR